MSDELETGPVITFRLHGCVIRHNELATFATATPFDDETGEAGETRCFRSEAKTHGSEHLPTATMQAIRWARMEMMAATELAADERRKKREQMLQEARARLRAQKHEAT